MKKTITCYVTALVFLAAPALSAEQKSVPNVLTFQSMLFDDGGNLIADGPVNITFRITDSSDSILYEEKQTVDALRGQVSAIVGGGLDANGAPTGGIPLSALDPASSRYLTVEVDGMPATSALEIASVPYAIYAGQALGAAKGAIDSAAIADGGIAYEDLGTDLIAKLASNLTGGRGAAGDMLVKSDLETMYRDPSSASSIGVKPGFVYSSANDLQGVLTDLDRAVKRRDEKVDNEASARRDHATAATGIHGVGTGQVVGTALTQTLENKTYKGSLSDTAGNHNGTWQGKNASNFTSAEGLATHTSSNISDAHKEGNFPISRLGDSHGVTDIATQNELDSAVAGETTKWTAADNAHAATPHVGAWCTISRWDSTVVDAQCINATLSDYKATSKCEVSFQQSMNKYALVAMPAVSVTNKGASSFIVSPATGGCPNFDFIAIGN